MTSKNWKIKLLTSTLLLTVSISTIANKPEIINSENQLLAIIDNTSPTITFCSMNHCPHCNKVAPEFEKLASQPKYKQIRFTQTNGPAINAHTHIKHESDGKFKVPGYPLFLFTKGKKIEHVMLGGNSEKLKDKIEEFLEKI